MKPIKNLRGFVQSLNRSGLFVKAEVLDGVVFARCRRDYLITCDILRHDYLHAHRVSYLEIHQVVENNILITVMFY